VPPPVSPVADPKEAKVKERKPRSPDWSASLHHKGTRSGARLRNSSSKAPDGHWFNKRVNASTTTVELAPDASIVADTAGTTGWFALAAAWIALISFICSDCDVSAAPATLPRPRTVIPAKPIISFLIITNILI
jgi:hypothetical protein